MQKLSVHEIEEVIASWQPADRRKFVAHLVDRYKQDFRPGLDPDTIESLGWTVLAQSSTAFWDNPEDAIYDRV